MIDEDTLKRKFPDNYKKLLDSRSLIESSNAGTAWKKDAIAGLEALFLASCFSDELELASQEGTEHYVYNNLSETNEKKHYYGATASEEKLYELTLQYEVPQESSLHFIEGLGEYKNILKRHGLYAEVAGDAANAEFDPNHQPDSLVLQERLSETKIDNPNVHSDIKELYRDTFHLIGDALQRSKENPELLKDEIEELGGNGCLAYRANSTLEKAILHESHQPEVADQQQSFVARLCATLCCKGLNR